MSYEINLLERPTVVMLKSGGNVRVRNGLKMCIEQDVFRLVNDDSGLTEFMCPIDNLQACYTMDETGETK